MTEKLSKVQQFMRRHPETRSYLGGIISGSVAEADGGELLDHHLNPMIRSIFAEIGNEVQPETLSSNGALHYINELSVFARYNSQFLRNASQTVLTAVPELAHELFRNHLEEGGERGRLPAHFVLYSSALYKDLDILVNGHVPGPSTQMLVFLHHVLVNSHCPSTLCGAYYATEGVAIDETALLQAITNRYGLLTHGRKGKSLPNLNYYYELHLDEQHEAADGAISVEQGHMDGIGRFVRDHRLYGLQLPQICDGFLQILEAMTAWWTCLAETCPAATYTTQDRERADDYV